MIGGELRAACATAAALLACAGCAGAPAAGLTPTTSADAELGWLAGTWATEASERRTVERWVVAAGSLYGWNETRTSEGIVHSELMRIWREDGELAFVAFPSGQATTRFALAAREGTTALFANPAHDFPTHVRYAREGDRLLAEVWREGGGERPSWSFALAPPAPQLSRVNAELCRAADAASIAVTLEPCYCAAEVHCAARARGSATDLQLVIGDRSCDACMEAQGTCAVPDIQGALTVHGAPAAASLAPGACARAVVPVLVVNAD